MVYFVTENRVKDFTLVLGNVDAKLINPLIPTISDMRIKDYLGTLFYDDLLDKYNAQTLSSDETEVVSIIQSAILWRAAEEVALTSSYQITNKGPQQQNGQNSLPPSDSAIGMISKHYAQKAEYYESRLINHLKINKDLFPLFISDANNDSSITDVIPITTQPYNRDINLF